jgi:NAD(P)H-hydrate epimerase
VASNRPTTIVDALFGIGLTRPLCGEFLQAVQAMNSARSAGTKILSIDIPSGICADTGEALGAAVQADLSVTFAAKKLGLELEQGYLSAGRVVIADIGIKIEA